MAKTTTSVITDLTGETRIDADKPLPLFISEEHATNATCGNAGECVIAQALKDHFGPMVDGFSVGANITKIHHGEKVVRYSTPAALRNSLRVFDITGKWALPPGKYTLRPLAKGYRRGNRWHKKRNSGGVQSVFRGRPAAPTRNAPTVCQIIAAARKKKQAVAA